MRGGAQERCRELLKQSCDANDFKILKGVVSAEHVHLHLLYPPKISVSEIARKLKGRSAYKLLKEFPSLKKRYYGGHFWSVGFGAWSSGNITDKMIDEYLDHHKPNPNSNDNFFLE